MLKLLAVISLLTCAIGHAQSAPTQSLSEAIAKHSAEALLATATLAAANPANTPEARQEAFNLRTAISAQLTALDQAVISNNTVALEAGEAQLSPGMTQSKDDYLKKHSE
jgi:predicted negative regulator of RcsB-dependent stress response